MICCGSLRDPFSAALAWFAFCACWPSRKSRVQERTIIQKADRGAVSDSIASADL